MYPAWFPVMRVCPRSDPRELLGSVVRAPPQLRLRRGSATLVHRVASCQMQASEERRHPPSFLSKREKVCERLSPASDCASFCSPFLIIRAILCFAPRGSPLPPMQNQNPPDAYFVPDGLRNRTFSDSGGSEPEDEAARHERRRKPPRQQSRQHRLPQPANLNRPRHGPRQLANESYHSTDEGHRPTSTPPGPRHGMRHAAHHSSTANPFNSSWYDPGTSGSNYRDYTGEQIVPTGYNNPYGARPGSAMPSSGMGGGPFAPPGGYFGGPGPYRPPIPNMYSPMPPPPPMQGPYGPGPFLQQPYHHPPPPPPSRSDPFTTAKLEQAERERAAERREREIAERERERLLRENEEMRVEQDWMQMREQEAMDAAAEMARRDAERARKKEIRKEARRREVAQRQVDAEAERLRVLALREEEDRARRREEEARARRWREEELHERRLQEARARRMEEEESMAWDDPPQPNLRRKVEPQPRQQEAPRRNNSIEEQVRIAMEHILANDMRAPFVPQRDLDPLPTLVQRQVEEYMTRLFGYQHHAQPRPILPPLYNPHHPSHSWSGSQVANLNGLDLVPLHRDREYANNPTMMSIIAELIRSMNVTNAELRDALRSQRYQSPIMRGEVLDVDDYTSMRSSRGRSRRGSEHGDTNSQGLTSPTLYSDPQSTENLTSGGRGQRNPVVPRNKARTIEPLRHRPRTTAPTTISHRDHTLDDLSLEPLRLEPLRTGPRPTPSRMSGRSSNSKAAFVEDETDSELERERERQRRNLRRRAVTPAGILRRPRSTHAPRRRDDDDYNDDDESDLFPGDREPARNAMHRPGPEAPEPPNPFIGRGRTERG
ncbi:hypothetical protein B0H63DRAFT_469932 [Podospora didyma]|uniref:Uncharacterized protein n=1 Tax=Podospora didyma TaxID=330526 RepID=A0AAE0U1B9_9PEZI|nr:hypothetical protein B0H63DRAFT_469932 [Podospora didyma]